MNVGNNPLFQGLESTKFQETRASNKTKEINQICLIINRHKNMPHTRVDSEKEKFMRSEFIEKVVHESAKELLDGVVIGLNGDKNAIEIEKERFKNIIGMAFKKYSSETHLTALTNNETVMASKCVEKHVKEMAEKSNLSSVPKNISQDKVKGELDRAATSYDRFCNAKEKIESTNQKISASLPKEHDFKIESLVVGAGDIGTHLWLQNKDGHHKTSDILDKKQMPDTLILAEDYGNWRHDYTLAQTHSLLERYESPSNPKDFTLTSNYEANSQVNARHLYQSNVISLSETDAPVCIGAKLIKVEKQSKHEADWKDDMKDCNLRANVRFALSKEEVVAIEKDGKSVWRSLDHLAKSEEKLKNELNVTDEDLAGNPPWKKGEEKFVYEPKLNRKGLPATIPITKKVDGKLETTHQPIFIKKKVIDKTVYTNDLDVCAGMGKTAPFGQYHTKTYVDKTPICTEANIKKLSKFDPELGFTPLCDGNTFMLTSKEESVWKEKAVSEKNIDEGASSAEATAAKTTEKKGAYKPRDIMISGGGGNATACYRKAYFGSDVNIENKTYDSKHRNSPDSEVYWTSMFGGFEDAGYGTLAKNAVSAAERDGRLFTAKPINVEPIIQKDADGKDVQKLKVTLIPVKGTFNKRNIDFPDEKKLQDKVNVEKNQTDNTVKEFTVIVDQFVFASGQDISEGLEKVAEEFKTEMQLNQAEIANPDDPDNPNQLTVGLSDKENAGLRMWGGAAQQFAKVTRNASGDPLNFNTPVRSYIQSQNLPADAEWPGVMPPTRFEVQYGTENAGQKEDVNINMEDKNVIKSFLLNANIKEDVAESFVNEVYQKRNPPPLLQGGITPAPAGISNKLLNEMIKSYKIEGEVEVVGHCILVYKKSVK